jgi:methylenetetrahydrofolate dehydrogenase (NADP+)/methenyltetrahydrofolate cyclohydrolase
MNGYLVEALMLGRSAIVGKPMAAMLLQEHCTVTLAHSRTRDLEAVCRGADILVAAIGRAGMIGPNHVRDGAVVIDVGINRVGDLAALERLYPGDAERRRQFDAGWLVAMSIRAAPPAAAITPVPGGVGLLTVAMVIANTLRASRRRQGMTVA